MIGLARRHWPSMMLYRHWPFVGVQLFTPPFHTAISHILEYLCVYFLPLFFVYKVEMHLQTKLVVFLTPNFGDLSIMPARPCG